MLRLGVDVGGTFTDLLLHDTDSDRVWLAKVPSTPHDQSRGVLEGIRVVGANAGVSADRLDTILHGTTVATNAVLEKRGARVGLLTSEGFRSILHLAEAWTPGPLFGWMIYEKPEPLATVEDIRAVKERVAADGRVLEPLDEAGARTAIVELRDAGVEALTVSLLNSFVNPGHERAVGQLAREEAPALPVSLSSEVLPEFREYERTVTTVVNAYVSPVLDRYLSSLHRGLEQEGTDAELRVVRSDGGLMSLESARSTPVHTVLSGPAGGVQGAAYVASRAGLDRILTFDMGGTSTDVATCVGGVPAITRETAVGEFPVRAPSVEVESIGAGGGSIAYVAEVTSALRVGPRSAGAEPGPACYGKGGTEATVTDANVVLGHLPPQLLGGAMELDVDAATAAIGSLGEALGLEPEATAAGVIDIVTENMLGALRVVTVQKGLAPSEFALVSFGGAGGLHANALAALLGCFPVLVPPESGVLSAMGFVASEIRNEFSQTFIREADGFSGRGTLGAARGSGPAGGPVARGRAGTFRRQGDRICRRHALPPPGLRAPDRRRVGRARKPFTRRARRSLQPGPPAPLRLWVGRGRRDRQLTSRRSRERAGARDSRARTREQRPLPGQEGKPARVDR